MFILYVQLHWSYTIYIKRYLTFYSPIPIQVKFYTILPRLKHQTAGWGSIRVVLGSSGEEHLVLM